MTKRPSISDLTWPELRAPTASDEAARAPRVTHEYVEVRRPHWWILLPFRWLFWAFVGCVAASVLGFPVDDVTFWGQTGAWVIIAFACWMTFSPKWRRTEVRRTRVLDQ